MGHYGKFLGPFDHEREAAMAVNNACMKRKCQPLNPIVLLEEKTTEYEKEPFEFRPKDVRSKNFQFFFPKKQTDIDTLPYYYPKFTKPTNLNFEFFNNSNKLVAKIEFEYRHE